MNKTITERLDRLRAEMAKRQVDACIVPTDDIHQSEYVSPHFKYRAYLSGFTGSAGTLVVTLDKAGLWTDSRYYLQAEAQLEGTGIGLFRTTEPDTPGIAEWLAGEQPRCVGFDGNVYAAGSALDLIASLEKEGCRIDSGFDSCEAVWTDRPELPLEPVRVYPESFDGESFASKLSRVRERLRRCGADTLPISGLDDIAWLTSLRGNDVAYNPVGLCFALLREDTFSLFIDPRKLTDETRQYLTLNKVRLMGYRDLEKELSKLPSDARVFVDRKRINYSIYSHIPSSCAKIEGISPVTDLKSVKNEVELAGTRQAVLRDGVTLLRLWRWFESRLEKGEPTDEYGIARQLIASRLEEEACTGESFEPIVSFGSNGAIVHYSPSQENCAAVSADGILLIDSGGQYLEGTTDITRTYSLYKDETPEAYKKDYALVLKGNIALAESIFPEHTRGCVIDAFARQFMWREGISYGHGTGHGVGHFLNVHEGPQSIRTEENPVTLKPGMLLSDEPGIYRTGRYGIRLENLICCTVKKETEYGRFLGFETLTLFPFDLKSIDKKYFTPGEIDWINAYHRRCREALAPMLTPEEQAWLNEKTREI